MRQIREVLRLKFGDDKISDRGIAGRLGIGRTTVQDYLARITAAGLTWPLPDDLTDVALEQRLFGRPEQTGSQLGKRYHAEPDWAALARELKRPGVNLMVLWEEYQQVHPEGYRYSRFCQLFRGFERKLSPVTQARYRARG